MNTDTNKDRNHRMALWNFQVMESAITPERKKQAEQWMFFWIFHMIVPLEELLNEKECPTNYSHFRVSRETGKKEGGERRV